MMDAVTPEAAPRAPQVTDAVMDAVTNDAGAPPGADAGTPALSEDPRWQAFVERVMGTEKKKLAADLHQSEVAAIGEGRIEILAPNEPAREKLIEELDWLAAPLAEAFGGDFRIVVDRDKIKPAAAGRSLHERKQAHEQARLEGLRTEAVADESVRRIQRFFPDGKVEAVHLPGSPNHERRNVR